MQSSLDLEIREWLARYLAGEISLRAFQEWFLPIAWNVEESENPGAVELAYDIELRLFEFSNGDWTEDELRRLLRPFVQNYTYTDTIAPVERTSSSSEVTRPPLTYRGSPVDTRFSAVYV